MEHEPPFLAYLRYIIPTRSVIEQAILRHFLTSLYDERLYVIGSMEGDEALDVFRQEYRTISGLFHVAHERSNQRLGPIGVLVSHPAPFVEGEWDMLSTTVSGCLQELLSMARLPPEGIVIPEGRHATVLMTVLPPEDPDKSMHNEVEFVFIFDRKLSQHEGMYLLHQGIQVWQDQHTSYAHFGQPRLH